MGHAQAPIRDRSRSEAEAESLQPRCLEKRAKSSSFQDAYFRASPSLKIASGAFSPRKMLKPHFSGPFSRRCAGPVRSPVDTSRPILPGTHSRDGGALSPCNRYNRRMTSGRDPDARRSNALAAIAAGDPLSGGPGLRTRNSGLYCRPIGRLHHRHGGAGSTSSPRLVRGDTIFSDSPNRPGLPSTVLRTGGVHESRTQHRFPSADRKD